jgi:formylglycine-generating enzyme required for sulfatase activity
LPTEAQWEYAAKGGNGSPGNYTYSGSNDIDEVAWYESNSGHMTHEVGKKKANGLGLYDMSGNVWEWCWDWYDSYSNASQTDPVGPVLGAYRVIRGGSWGYSAGYVRSAYRFHICPSYWFIDVGFRVVRP